MVLENHFLAIPFGLLCSYGVLAIFTAIASVHFHPLSKFPGPWSRAAFSFLDAFSNLRGTGNIDIKRLHDVYGPVVRIAPNSLSFKTAQAWRDIYGFKKNRTELAKDPDYYQKGPAIQILSLQPVSRIWSLVLMSTAANQTEHTRIRKLLAPAFSENALLEQEPLLNYHFELLVSKLKQQIDSPSKGRIDLMSQYNFVAFDIISDLVLGEPFGALENGESHPWMRNFFEAIKFLGVIRLAAAYPFIGLLFRMIQFLRPSLAAKRVAHLNFTKKKIDERLNRETNRKDLIQYVLPNGMGAEQSLSHDEVLGNARVLLTAGSETTATHLCGATWYLLTHPAALHRAQLEVRNAFQKSEDINLRSVTVNDGKLLFLNAVIEETLRCYPSIPSTLPRVTSTGGNIIDGYSVPANTSVGVHHWSANRSSSNFVAADAFLPERWLSDEAPSACSRDKKDAMQPFSLGPRACLGKSLAYYEIRSILTRVLWHFDMQLEDDSRDWIIQKEYVFWDKSSLWVRLSHRSA